MIKNSRFSFVFYSLFLLFSGLALIITSNNIIDEYVDVKDNDYIQCEVVNVEYVTTDTYRIYITPIDVSNEYRSANLYFYDSSKFKEDTVLDVALIPVTDNRIKVLPKIDLEGAKNIKCLGLALLLILVVLASYVVVKHHRSKHKNNKQIKFLG